MEDNQGLNGMTTVSMQAGRTSDWERTYRLVLDSLPQKLFVKDREFRYVLCNKRYAEGLGISTEGIAGKTDFDFYPRDLAEKYRADDARIMSGGSSATITERYVEQGEERFVQTVKAPLTGLDGDVMGLLGIFWDVTEQVKAEEARKKAEEVIRRQAQEILEISNPVVQVWDGVVAVPLIGTLDSQRTQQVTEQLLHRIVDTRSAVALIDITGVPAIDTQTARHLTETITAVRLLGAQAILTGIRPAIAQTLVHLGVDLSGVITRSSLAAGLRVALDVLNLQVAPKGDVR